jgi:hypothetical protein
MQSRDYHASAPPPHAISFSKHLTHFMSHFLTTQYRPVSRFRNNSMAGLSIWNRRHGSSSERRLIVRSRARTVCQSQLSRDLFVWEYIYCPFRRQQSVVCEVPKASAASNGLFGIRPAPTHPLGFTCDPVCFEQPTFWGEDKPNEGFNDQHIYSSLFRHRNCSKQVICMISGLPRNLDRVKQTSLYNSHSFSNRLHYAPRGR